MIFVRCIKPFSMAFMLFASVINWFFRSFVFIVIHFPAFISHSTQATIILTLNIFSKSIPLQLLLNTFSQCFAIYCLQCIYAYLARAILLIIHSVATIFPLLALAHMRISSPCSGSLMFALLSIVWYRTNSDDNFTCAI